LYANGLFAVRKPSPAAEAGRRTDVESSKSPVARPLARTVASARELLGSVARASPFSAGERIQRLVRSTARDPPSTIRVPSMHPPRLRTALASVLLASSFSACAGSTATVASDPCDPESPDYDQASCETPPTGSGGSGGAKADAGRAGAKAGGASTGGTRVTTGGSANTGGSTVHDTLQVPDASPGTGYQPLEVIGGPGTLPDGVPPGMPDYLAVGIGEVSPGDTWMASSGVTWDLAYKYFTNNWWTWGSPTIPASYASGYFAELDALGTIPAVQYYVVNAMPPQNDEQQFYEKVKKTDLMKQYFTAFRYLMERAKDFDKPVLVLLEADGFGYLQQKSGNNPSAYAAVKSSGVPEIADLPDTVAGWGMAFLQIRKKVGAGKAILGIHVSAWASGQDIANGNPSANIQSAVDSAYNFLAPLGVAKNQTGYQYDVLVGDPSDRDADFYKLTQGNGAHWWDTSAGASTSSLSFNRYAEWLRLWRQKAKMRWVLWQIPCGNSQSPNNATGGYKDNRPEYFFGAAANRQKFVDAGVVALLFGAGEGQQTGYGDDHDVIKNGAATYLASPLTLP
jgi:hypothetical protein